MIYCQKAIIGYLHDKELNMSQPEIYPVFERMLCRSNKEKLLNQRALVFWVYGLSGSGKTTIALGLEKALHQKGYLTQVLDGDNIRSGINNNLGFSAEDRAENLRRIAEVNKLFIDCGVITINCFISPLRENRALVKQLVGEQNFIEIFVNTPLEICEQRDIKGLYAKARAGIIKNFSGIDTPFEHPQNPDFQIDTSCEEPDFSIQKVLNYILPKIKY